MELFSIGHNVRIQALDGGYGDVLVEIAKDLKIIQKQNQLIMASITELTQKVDTLETKVDGLTQAIDTEQQEIADAINDLKQTNAELQLIIAEGGTAEQRQALSDKLTNITTKLETAQTDLASTISTEPPVEGGL